MLVKDPDDLSHLRFDPRETFGSLAFELQVTSFEFPMLPLELHLGAVGLPLAVYECGLILDQRGQCLIETTMAILWSGFCHRNLRPLRDPVHFAINRGGGIRTHDLLLPRQAR